jgi:YidC/Oxa1 family membrane protein insertase
VIAGLIMTGRSASTQQRMLSMGLPVIFTPIMIGFPAGLLVYWISTNVWTMGQQAVVKLFFPADEPAEAAKDEDGKPVVTKAPPPPPRKRKRRK